MIKLSLFILDIYRSPTHQILAVIALGEGNHVPDGAGLGEDGHESVQTNGDPCMWRTSTGQGSHQMLQFTAIFLKNILQNKPLVICRMDSDTSSCYFLTIQNQIIM